MSNFVKEGKALESNTDKWMYLLKHLHGLNKLPKYLDKRVFRKIFQIGEVSKLQKEERMAYEASLKAKWDWQNALAYAEKTAREEERVKAEARIREERAKAEVKVLEEKQKIAKELKKLGMSVSNISKSTGLSHEEIEGL